MRTAQTYPQFAVQLSTADWSSRDLELVRAAFDLAASLFSAAERGSGKPFIDHLIGTASAVLLGGGNPSAVAAALLHAAYDQGDFGDGRRGPRPKHRRLVVEAVGPLVEDLVFRYHQMTWTNAAASREALCASDAPEPKRAVLLVRVANEIDDAMDGALVLSGKDRLPTHGRMVHEDVVRLAEIVGTAQFAVLARSTLLDEQPKFPPELVIGVGASRVCLPSSAKQLLRVRLVLLLRRMKASAKFSAARRHGRRA